MNNQNEICAWGDNEEQQYLEDLMMQKSKKKLICKRQTQRPQTAYCTQKAESTQITPIFHQKLKSQSDLLRSPKISSASRIPSQSVFFKKKVFSPLQVHKIQMPEPLVLSKVQKKNLHLKQKKFVTEQPSERVTPLHFHLQPFSPKIIRNQIGIKDTIRQLFSKEESGPYDEEFIKKEMNSLANIQTRIKQLNAMQKHLLRRIKH